MQNQRSLTQVSFQQEVIERVVVNKRYTLYIKQYVKYILHSIDKIGLESGNQRVKNTESYWLSNKKTTINLVNDFFEVNKLCINLVTKLNTFTYEKVGVKNPLEINWLYIFMYSYKSQYLANNLFRTNVIIIIQE